MQRLSRISRRPIALLLYGSVVGVARASVARADLTRADLNGYGDIRRPNSNGVGAFGDTCLEIEQSGDSIRGMLTPEPQQIPRSRMRFRSVPARARRPCPVTAWPVNACPATEWSCSSSALSESRSLSLEHWPPPLAEHPSIRPAGPARQAHRSGRAIFSLPGKYTF